MRRGGVNRHKDNEYTARAFKDWNAVFPDATTIATMLDRLRHHADVTVIEGQSYRGARKRGRGRRHLCN